jgi:DNA-binding XRE family transcriptional regulator
MNVWTPKQIKSLRVKHKISQIKLGKLLGVTTNYIYLLEKGVKNPSKTLCLLLDCVEEKIKKKGGEK